jgi:ATP-binding cassette subfamily B (MDR/TAP) protein 1
MAADCTAIHGGLGEKLGNMIMSYGMSLAGFVFAFMSGWKLSLILMGSFPVLITSSVFMMKIMEGSFSENMKAYARSGGYAEQALNAIKVVSAFS